MKTLFFLLCSFAAFAQKNDLTLRSNTEGLTVNVGGSYCRWSSSYFNQLDEREPNGLGGSLHLGYGIDQRLEVFARYERHSFQRNLKDDWDTYRLSTVGVGGRWNFGGTLQALRPYAELGVAFQSLKIDPVLLNGNLFTYKLSGPAVQLGLGAHYFVLPDFALNLHVGGTIGKFSSFLANDAGLEDRPDVKTLRVGVGVCYFLRL
jgi:Outer membrane protein beta-barrel domain